MSFVPRPSLTFFLFFFFNDTATTEIYTLSLHDALPICQRRQPEVPEHEARQARASPFVAPGLRWPVARPECAARVRWGALRSEEHTSELQSRLHLVCRLLLEKKKKDKKRERNYISYKNT